MIHIKCNCFKKFSNENKETLKKEYEAHKLTCKITPEMRGYKKVSENCYYK